MKESVGHDYDLTAKINKDFKNKENKTSYIVMFTKMRPPSYTENEISFEILKKLLYLRGQNIEGFELRRIFDLEKG